MHQQQLIIMYKKLEKLRFVQSRLFKAEKEYKIYSKKGTKKNLALQIIMVKDSTCFIAICFNVKLSN